jgi:ABC-type sugar transport system permease subunit
MGPVLSGYVGGIINRVSSVMWMSGIQIIIFLGALQTIPQQLYEAAVVDGASEFDKLWKITLPLTMPAILLNIVYTLIDSFTSSNNQVIAYISKVSFTDFLLTYGSALSWVYFLIIGIILAIVFAVMRRRTFYLG